MLPAPVNCHSQLSKPATIHYLAQDLSQFTTESYVIESAWHKNVIENNCCSSVQAGAHKRNISTGRTTKQQDLEAGLRSCSFFRLVMNSI